MAIEKVLDGVKKFNDGLREEYRKAFSYLESGQNPKTLFITCCDSRVVPHAFTSSNPGDLFVLRNIGNIIPEKKTGHSWWKTYKQICKIYYHVQWSPDTIECDTSVWATIEYAIKQLAVSNIIVCGHSDCGAMKALLNKEKEFSKNFRGVNAWLKHAKPTLKLFKKNLLQANELSEADALSQTNVVQQLEHLKTYHEVRELLDTGALSLHGWWFDIGTATVHAYDEQAKNFFEIK